MSNTTMDVITPPKGLFTNLFTFTTISWAAAVCVSLSFLLPRFLTRGKRLLTPAERGIAQYGKAGDQDFHKALVDGYTNVKIMVPNS